VGTHRHLEYQHCLSVARSNVHVVFMEQMLLIGPQVNADVFRLTKVFQGNGYPVAVHRFAPRFRRRLIEHDADLAASTFIGGAVGLGGVGADG
jgi:hypothetical protein